MSALGGTTALQIALDAHERREKLENRVKDIEEYGD